MDATILKVYHSADLGRFASGLALITDIQKSGATHGLLRLREGQPLPRHEFAYAFAVIISGSNVLKCKV